MGRLEWFGAAALGSLLSSCLSTTDVVRSRFATEQSCPKDQVRVDEEGGTQYRARGCDKEAVYVCDKVAAFKGGVECVQEGLRNPPGYEEREKPPSPTPDPAVPGR